MKIKCFAAAVLLMLILPFCTGCASALTAEENFNSAGKGAADMQHFTTNTPVRDVMNHPAFKNFGQFLFPTDFYTPSAGMTIAGADSLLPYHTAIKPDTSAAVLNYLLAETENGRQVFYNIYSENARRRNPALQNTGLFFFKGNPGSPFAVICAGGGFVYVGSIHESFPHALELSKKGYNAFALQYRTGSAQAACEDLAAALTFIFKNAAALGVSTDCYSLWGGSAGARMAAYLGSYGPAAFGGAALPKPGAVIMQYTGHSDYTPNDPPTFACVGEKDGIAPWRTMKRRIDNLNAFGIDTEFHKYPNLKHGFGLGISTSAEGWLNDAAAFWQKQIDKNK